MRFPSGSLQDVRIFHNNSCYNETRPDISLQDIEVGKSIEVTLDENLVLALDGLYWVECKPKSNDGLSIETKQRLLSGKIGRGEATDKLGYWRNPLFIDDLSVLYQKRINYWLIVLTAIAVVFTVLLYFKGS